MGDIFNRPFPGIDEMGKEKKIYNSTDLIRMRKIFCLFVFGLVDKNSDLQNITQN